MMICTASRRGVSVAVGEGIGEGASLGGGVSLSGGEVRGAGVAGIKDGNVTAAANPFPASDRLAAGDCAAPTLFRVTDAMTAKTATNTTSQRARRNPR